MIEILTVSCVFLTAIYAIATFIAIDRIEQKIDGTWDYEDNDDE